LQGLLLALRLDQRGVDRQFADAFVRHRCDGAPHGWEQCRCCRLSNAARRLGAINNLHLDNGDFIDSHHAIAVEASLLDVPILEVDLAPQYGRCPKDDAALDLRANAVRIHDMSAIITVQQIH
jgi:hypothetical protein